MKKYYNFGEIILALRDEYNECKYLLEELKKCINIKSDNSNFYFRGLLSGDDEIQNLSDRKIELIVEKKYLDILKKIQYLKYDWYSQYFYSAAFCVEKKYDGSSVVAYKNVFTPFNGRKYIPEVEIIDQSKFSEFVDELFSTDLFQMKKRCFSNNHDYISLNFDYAYISTPLGNNSFIGWNGTSDDFKYSITKHNSPSLIKDILSLEIPADKISSDWLILLEKHENDYNKKVSFDVDINAQSKEGVLQISDIKNTGVVKLLKKTK